MSDVDNAGVSEMSPLANACCVDGAVVAQLAQPQTVTVVSAPALSDKLGIHCLIELDLLSSFNNIDLFSTFTLLNIVRRFCGI